jgi:hypothetical protein
MGFQPINAQDHVIIRERNHLEIRNKLLVLNDPSGLSNFRATTDELTIGNLNPNGMSYLSNILQR